ncbi:MAG: DUF2334 domain-containing protein [Nanoarchaeota archaeon]|nr:DUF2334 domain-containing protein [Nanoarchaeota archaeon]
MKDSHLTKTKVFFFILLVFFLAVISSGLHYSDEGSNLNVWKSIDYIENNITKIFEKEKVLLQYGQGEYCEFKPQNNTIILRLDDIAAWRYKEISNWIITEILSRDMGVTLGVIPQNLGKDPKVVKYLNNLKMNPLIEISLHGFNHEENEFLNLNEEEALSKIIAGKNEIVNVTGVVPATFIPPYNEYSSEVKDALMEQGFKIFSAKEDEYNIDQNYYSIGYNARTYDFYTKRFIPVEEIISDCRQSLNKTGICVVMIHPQDYLAEPSSENIDLEKYNEFLKLLNELQELDVQFKTFKDLIECHN